MHGPIRIRKWECLESFRENPKYKFSGKVLQVWVYLFHADRHDEANSRFTQLFHESA